MTHWNMYCSSELDNDGHNTSVECSNYQKAKSLMLMHQKYYPNHKVEIVQLDKDNHDWDIGVNSIRCMICSKSIRMPDQVRINYNSELERLKKVFINCTLLHEVKA